MQRSARREYQLFVFLRKGDVTRFAQSEKRVPVGKPGRHAAEPKLRSRWAHAFCSDRGRQHHCPKLQCAGQKNEGMGKDKQVLALFYFPKITLTSLRMAIMNLNSLKSVHSLQLLSHSQDGHQLLF